MKFEGLFLQLLGLGLAQCILLSLAICGKFLEIPMVRLFYLLSSVGHIAEQIERTC